MNRYRVAIVLALLCLALAGVAGAQPSTDTPPGAPYEFDPEQNLEPSGGDISVQLLEGVLGPVVSRVRFAESLSEADTGPFGGLFALFNGFMLLLMALSLFVKFVAALLDTAYEGEALGRDRSTAWTPVRIFLSAVMLIPLVNGYSFIQVLVLWATLAGVGLADALWWQAVDQFSATALYSQPPPPQARQLAVAMLASNLCERVVESIPARNGGYQVNLISRVGDLGHYDERWVRWSARGLGAAACGGFHIREPHRSIDPDQALSGIGLVDWVFRWLRELLGFADEVRQGLSARLMAAHEQAALRMREELRPPMLWLIEGYAAIPIVWAFLPFSLTKLYIALAVVALLTVIRYLGYDALSAYRTLLTLLIMVLAGGVIRSVLSYLMQKS